MLRSRVCLAVVLLALGAFSAGCLVLGVVLRLDVAVSDDATGFRVVEDRLFIDTSVIDRDNPPPIETEVRFRLTGTMGSVRIEEVIVTYAELAGDETVGAYEKVPPRHQVDLHLVAVGDMSKTETISFALPEAIRTKLRDDPDTLVGRAYEFKLQPTGTGKNPSFRFVVEFEKSATE